MTIAIAGIASVTVIIVAMVMSAGYIATHSKEVKNGYQPKEAKPSAPQIKTLDVLYLCDRSGWCGCDECGLCVYTLNIEHAVNFKQDMFGHYREIPKESESRQ